MKNSILLMKVYRQLKLNMTGESNIISFKCPSMNLELQVLTQ